MAWLTKNPQVTFHFTVKVLIAQIRDYITHWNINPTPFVWTATADEILAKVRIVQTNIKKLVENNAKQRHQDHARRVGAVGVVGSSAATTTGN